MSRKPEKDDRSPEERVRERSILRTRGDALRWAYEGNNMSIVRIEYRRRVNRGDSLLMAWRRALWVTFKEHGHA